MQSSYRIAFRMKASTGWLGSLANSAPLMTLVLVCAYLILAAILPPGGLYLGDQGVKLAQIEALASGDGLVVGTVDEPLSVFRRAFNGSFYHEIDGKYHGTFSSAYSLLVLPFYRMFGLWGVVLPSVVGAGLAAYSCARLGRLLGIRRTSALVLVAGLATPIAFYALVFWEHALSAGLIASATCFAIRKQGVRAGILSGLSVWLRPESYLYAPVVVAASIVGFGWRGGFRFALRYGLGFVLGCTPWWVFNALTTKTPLGLSAGKEPNTYMELSMRLEVFQQYFLPLGQKKWLLMLAIVLLAAIVLRMARRPLSPCLWLFWIGVVGLGLIHLMQGQVGYSVTDVFPFGFASVAVLLLARTDERLRFLWALFIGYLLMLMLSTLSLPNVLPGGGWGLRYALALYPLLVVLSWFSFEAARGWVVRSCMIALLAFSLILQTIGVGDLYRSTSQWERLNDELLALRPPIVSTAIWWLPQVAAPTLRQIQWYGVTDENDFDLLSNETDDFWWVWTNEPAAESGGHAVQNLAALPGDSFSVVGVQKLSTRGLEAVRYKVVRHDTLPVP